jgi:23S rRNA (guanosine2251-2'-O)-methyltransferase
MKPTQLLYGFHAITSRIKHHPGSVKKIYLDQDRHDARARDFLELIKMTGTPLYTVDGSRLDGMAGTRRHQGVVAEVEAVRLIRDLDEVVTTHGNDLLLLVLDGIQDPHNLGACLRVADAMGVQAVVAPKDRAVPMSPTVAKVASGAADTVPYLTVTNLARTLRELQDHRVWIVGTDDAASQDLSQADFQCPMAWVLGAEGSGLRRLTREHCDQLVKIPMQGAVESLNVSVAAGICLYESRRRQGFKN